jgi:hypothetical protein
VSDEGDGTPPGFPLGVAPPPAVGAARAPMDLVSVLALAASLVGLLVASVPLAIVGVVRTNRGVRSGRWAAIAATVLSAAWLVVGGIGFALHTSLGSGSTSASGTSAAEAAPVPGPSVAPPAAPPVAPAPTPSATPPKPAKVVTHRVYIGLVKPGHCFNEPRAGSVFVPELTTCAAPHDEEMMGMVQLGVGRYPGASAARSHASAACDALFTRFVGVSPGDSSLGVETWWPSPSLWSSGHHSAQCAVYTPGKKTVGTLRGVPATV